MNARDDPYDEDEEIHDDPCFGRLVFRERLGGEEPMDGAGWEGEGEFPPTGEAVRVRVRAGYMGPQPEHQGTLELLVRRYEILIEAVQEAIRRATGDQVDEERIAGFEDEFALVRIDFPPARPAQPEFAFLFEGRESPEAQCYVGFLNWKPTEVHLTGWTRADSG